MTITQPSNGDAQATPNTQASTPAEIPYQEYERARRSGKSIAEMTAPQSAPEAKPAPEQKKSPVSEPEETDENDETVDGEAEQSAESDAEKPKKKGGFQRRIDKLNARHAQAQKEAEYWRQLALKQGAGSDLKPDSLDATKTQTASSPTDGKPDPGRYDTHAEYVEALTDWKIEQREKTAKAEAERTRLKNEQESVQKAHLERVKSFAEQTDDFHEVIENVDDVPVSAAVQEMIISSEHGPALMYELAKNRAEFERINSLSPLAAARELGRIESRLSSNSSEEKTQETKKLTKAPKPLEPVSAGSSKVVKKSIADPDLSFAEYEKLRREQQRRRRG